MPMLFVMISLISGDAYVDSFAAASQAYDAGNYAAAIEKYEQLVADQVVSPTVFYNLGNAYYRSGRISAAIANYERALMLDPNLDSAQLNLEKAVRDTKQHLARPLPPAWEQSLLFWHYGISRRSTFVLAGIFWFLFWIVLSVRLWRPLRFSRSAAVALGLLAAAFAVSAWDKAHPTPLAVADADPTPVRYGINESETVRFNLFPGDRVTIDKRTKGWVRVVTAGGERGWTQESNLFFVGPPYEVPARHAVPEAKEISSK